MFHIRVKLDKSLIHGIGLFADQDIGLNEKIYTINPLLDLVFSEIELEKLADDEKDTIMHYGFFDNRIVRQIE